MSIAIPLTAMLLTFLVVFTFFRVLGAPSDRLLFTKGEKLAWDKELQGSLGSWLTVTNIFGTLTSFATFLFLAGSAKLFGLATLVTGVTIVIGAYVTNWLTARYSKGQRLSNYSLIRRNPHLLLHGFFGTKPKTDGGLHSL